MTGTADSRSGWRWEPEPSSGPAHSGRDDRHLQDGPGPDREAEATGSDQPPVQPTGRGS